MILMTARELSRQFDVEPVFKNVTFDIRPGERIGLVGPNGTGKTTLLNILAGHDDPDTGVVELHSSATIALLEQSADFDSERTLIQEARSGLAHLYHLQHESYELAERMAVEKDPTQQAKLHKRFDFLQQELHRLDAYHIDYRVDEVLLGLGFSPEDYERPLVTFSGGQQNRVLLARLLLQSPDVMLLDEPTNHLDIAATEWLEDFLVRCKQAMILVSHDRYFLDKVTTRILEMHQTRVTDYPGNFSHYWTQREERQKVQLRTWEKQQEFIAKTEDFIRRNKSGQKSAQAHDRERKLERLEEVEVIQDFQELSMNFGEPSRTGDWVIDAIDLAKGFGGEPLFQHFNVRIHRGDRVGILGPNGSGKTTLLKTLIGEYEPDAGKVRMGTGVKIGYFDQQLESVDSNLDAIEAARPMEFPEITPGTMRSLLARFGIRGELALQKVGAMSGGERSKVALTKLAARNVNVMILDEPTNHLDLWARDSLEQALKAFDGTLMFVSHDRYFLDRVANLVIMLEDGKWQVFEGNYSDFLAFQQSIQRGTPETLSEKPSRVSEQKSEPTPDKAEKSEKSKKETKRKRKFPYRKVADLEEEIAEKEMLLEQLEADLGNPEVHRDPDRLQDTMEAYEETKEELETLYEHWEEAVELN